MLRSTCNCKDVTLTNQVLGYKDSRDIANLQG